MNNQYKNKFIFVLQYYVENNGTPYIYIPQNYFVTKKDKAFKKSTSEWIPRLLNQYLGGVAKMGGIK